jgi:hypothetical protein
MTSADRKSLLMGRASVRDLAEDETAPLRDAVLAYLTYTNGGIGSIADVLLSRACKALAASADLARFRVAGFDDESMAYDQPVEVRCGQCGEARQFTWRDDGGADYSESLPVLITWAQSHQCPNGETP